MGSPISEDGSAVEYDSIPIEQFHRKKPYSPSMENEFASPPGKTRGRRRLHDYDDDAEEQAQRYGRQDTQSRSPLKKMHGYNTERDTKEYMAARRLSGQQ